MSNEQLIALLQKAVIDTSSGNGLASPRDADEFLDLTVDQTAILQALRVETGITTKFHLDTLNISEPVITLAADGVAPAAADVVAPDRVRKTLEPTEVIAAFDVSYSFLRKNISRERVNEQLNALFAKRFGKDVVLVAFMGDTTAANDTRKNKALRCFDGLVKKALADPTVHDVTIPASPSYNSTVFPALVQALPKDYRDDRENLGLYVSNDVYDAYAAEIGSRATALGDLLLAGPWERNLSYMGITLYPVFGLDTGRALLTLRENLAVGFGQEMTVGIDLDNRARVMKVTMTAEVDAEYALGDAIVLGATA